MPHGKFLITDTVPEGFVEGFSAMGFEAVYYPTLSREDFAKLLPELEGVVINTSLLLTKELIDTAVKLKYVLRPGSGMDNIDVAYARSQGIQVFSSPEANKDAVAEHAIGLLLSLCNHLPKAIEEVRQWQWIRKPNTGLEIKGKTVAIIGYGLTGSAFAKKLSGFEAEILAYDKFKTGFNTPYCKESSWEEIFEKADMVSFHVPLTPETRHYFNAELLGKFRKPIWLLNTSRGEVFDLEALLNGVKNGAVLGAGLDVLPNENLPSYTPEENSLLQALMDTGRVLITPHIAGWTQEARRNIFFFVFEKLRRHMSEAP